MIQNNQNYKVKWLFLQSTVVWFSTVYRCFGSCWHRRKGRPSCLLQITVIFEGYVKCKGSQLFWHNWTASIVESNNHMAWWHNRNSSWKACMWFWQWILQACSRRYETNQMDLFQLYNKGWLFVQLLTMHAIRVTHFTIFSVQYIISLALNFLVPFPSPKPMPHKITVHMIQSCFCWEEKFLQWKSSILQIPCCHASVQQ